jgi:hypothetical protein
MRSLVGEIEFEVDWGPVDVVGDGRGGVGRCGAFRDDVRNDGRRLGCRFHQRGVAVEDLVA